MVGCYYLLKGHQKLDKILIMKTIITNITKAGVGLYKQCFIVMIAILASTGVMKADIINPSATTSDGYLVNGTSNVVIQTLFETSTVEFVADIQFSVSNPAMGVTLSHGLPSPSPFGGCGSNSGDEISNMGSISWNGSELFFGDPCGAFSDGILVDFGISITTDNTVSGPIVIDVTFTGDGFGEAAPSVQTVQVVIQQQECEITCPADITMAADAGMCGAQVNIPLPEVSGNCTPGPQDMSGFYEVGTTEVVFVANSGGAVESTCSMFVTVVDTQDPVVANCSNITETLDAGECDAMVTLPFTVSDNCPGLDIALTQNGDNENIETSVACPGGASSYYRIFDLDALNITTDVTIESVTYGVFESFNDPVVTVNLYRYTGSLDQDDLELVSTNAETLPNSTNFFQTTLITGEFDKDESLVVEIVAPAAIVAGFNMGFNTSGQTAPTYFKTDFCGVEDPEDLNASFPGFGALITLNGSQAAFDIEQTDNSGNSIDEPFAPGVYNLEFDVTDAAGNSSSCDFTVEVVGFDTTISSIACNDAVNISLDDDCEVPVTADMILEGGNYGCYDDYVVTITNSNGVTMGNIINESHIGMTLTATVTDPNGNSCWGELVVEDKLGPSLDCQDVYTTCTGGTAPEDVISEMVTFAGDVAGLTIDDVNPSTTTIPVDVFGLNGATVTDINVVIEVDHTFPSDLIATVKAPNGDEVTLFVLPSGFCPAQGIRVTLDDEAMNTAADLANGAACDPAVDPAISGAYQPDSPLSEFDGIDPNGEWTITISDVFNGDGGDILSAKIVVSQQGGNIGFPTSNDITFTQIDDQIYTVNGIDECGPVTLGYNDNVLEQDCSSNYTQIIERTWSGSDDSGNAVFGCVQTIYVYRNDLSTLTFPPNYDGIQAPTLSCEFYGDNVPTPAVTGEPTGDFCDNVQIFPYEDTRVDICPGSYKIIRKFKLLEWCNSELIEHTQIIKVEDNEGPEVAPIDDITISANADECLGDITLNRPTVISECTPLDQIEYSLSYAIATDGGEPDPDAFYVSANVSELFNGNFLVRDLPVGRIWIQWTISDQCGNDTQVRFTIVVEDQVAPFAVCKEFTVVSLGGNGRAVVNALAFDNGSFDNCGEIQTYRARKMTDACGIPNSQFTESVEFCCEEKGQSIMVEFQVTDFQGLSNTCMVEISVQDKLPPFITFCPADITLDCQSSVDPEVTGYIEFIDNCEVVSDGFEDFVQSENQCGERVIRRTFTVEDAEGFKNSCVQIITLETDQNDIFTEDDINWPDNVDQIGCLEDIDPDNAPGPTFDDTGCSLVAAYSEDQVFTLADACIKILRTWTVIDWCQYNEENPVQGEGIWTDVQVIKLSNNTAPTFISNCNDRTECIYGEDCSGSITLSANATDDCTPNNQIRYSYELDLGNDGIIDFTGTTSQLTRVFTPGENRITWRAEDGCGNFTNCSYVFTVVDCKKPTPYCITSLTTVVMPSSGMITINAEDFNFGSFDNCTAEDDLLYSFSANVNDVTRTFTCADIPNGESADVSLRMYVTDESGNRDYCTIEIVLQEGNEDQCSEAGNKVTISGSVRTEEYESIADVNVIIESNAPEQDDQMTTLTSGTYVFNELPLGYNYEITGDRNGDYDNGVSTLDLVLIQRHILGYDEFTSPYKVIASDIDDNQKVSASDIVALRKLVLGVQPVLPNGQPSWRFVDASFTFDDILSPWPFDESITFDNINSHQTQQDLIAVKIGDVNSSATYNVNGVEMTETRSSNTVTFVTDANDVKEDRQYSIPVYAQDFTDILGYQFTIEFDNNNLTYVGYEIGALIVDNQHFALNRVDQGMITTSWSDVEAVTVPEDEPLFYLNFIARGNGSLTEMIDFTSRVTDAEVYDIDYIVHGAELSFRDNNNEILVEGLTVEQNRPNPFTSTTDIVFNIDGDSEVTLTVMDMAGKILRTITNDYQSGKHTITLDTDGIAASGVLYYRLDADQGSVVKKMIKIK